MESPNANTVPTLAERLKSNKVTCREIANNCNVPYYRINKYIEDQAQEGDVTVVNEILETIDKIFAGIESAKEENQRKLNALLNTEAHPVTD